MIPHYRPSLGQEEITAVTEVLRSGQIAQGGQVYALEKTLTEKIGRRYACAVSSGTTALILALKALKTGPGNEVIIPSYTCAALWQAVTAIGATPIYAEIENETFNLDPEAVKLKISSRTKAIIFPHMFGQPGYIREIMNLGIPVIEDIAQAYGAEIDGDPAGHFGILSVSSFYATKIIGAGEGGIVLTDSKDLIEAVRDLREYDEKDDLRPRQNAKMTDLCAAIAIEQLKKHPQFTARRASIIENYRQVTGLDFQLPSRNSHLKSNNYRCVAKHPRKAAAECILTASKMGARFRHPVYRPLHLYEKQGSLPRTEQAWQSQFSIPLFPALSEIEYREILKILNHLSKL